jgi:antitoxin component YwqK of YwqJK toxin-antitoxin module
MNYKILLLTFYCFAFAMQTNAQTVQYIYYFDENLAIVEKSKSIITGKGAKEDGGFRLDCFYNITNNLFLIAYFKDSSLLDFHGNYAVFYSNRKIKEKGYFQDNMMTGTWLKWDESGKIIDSSIYENGVRMRFAKTNYNYSGTFMNGKLLTDSSNYNFVYQFSDSLKDAYIEQYYSVDGTNKKLKSEAIFLGDKGINKVYDSLGQVKVDSIFNKEVKEAEYASGDIGWRKLMRENLNGLVPVDKGAPGGIYQVIAKFVVDIDGSFFDLEIENDPGYGMGNEAIRVLKKMEKWKPAMKYGKPVKAYRRQPITFQVSEE